MNDKIMLKMKWLIILAWLWADLAMAGNGIATLPPVVPRPVEMVLRDGVFTLDPSVAVVADAALTNEAEFLAVALKVPVAAKGKAIRLRLDAQLDKLGVEGYRLTVASDGIEIVAPKPAGIFYGAQTLLQLCETNSMIPCVAITDAPRFSWRGFMLDDARHFLGKQDLFKLLDLMGKLKLNQFVWQALPHLELKSYPQVTAQCKAGQFYTQADIREIVRFAADRHIHIVPLVEIPAHAEWLIKAYPEFAAPKPKNRDLINFVSPAAEKAVREIIAEICGLIPGPYLHLGADETGISRDNWDSYPEFLAVKQREALVTSADLEAWYLKRMLAYVRELGRTPMYWWGEPATLGLADGALPTFWQDGTMRQALKERLQAAKPVVLCPHFPLYFDYVNLKGVHKLGRTGRLDNTVANVYGFPDTFPPDLLQAVPNLSQATGLQAELWGETVGPTNKRVWFLTATRLVALAEAAWTPREQKDYPAFQKALPVWFKYFEQMGIPYFNPLNPDRTPEPTDNPRLSKEK